MPQGRRKTPFSGKKKKRQILSKRVVKRKTKQTLHSVICC